MHSCHGSVMIASISAMLLTSVAVMMGFMEVMMIVARILIRVVVATMQ